MPQHPLPNVLARALRSSARLRELFEYQLARVRLKKLTNRELVLACVGLNLADNPIVAEMMDRLDRDWHLEEALQDEATADRAITNAVRKATGRS